MQDEWPDGWEFESALFQWEASHQLMVLAALPEKASDDIDAAVPLKGGFGSVRVRVRIGTSTWSTSVFPDSKRGCYIVPVKAEVRRREGVDLGDTVRIRIELLDG